MYGQILHILVSTIHVPFQQKRGSDSLLYLFPTKKDAAFHNLTTETNVLVTGILFHAKADVVRAIGIEYRERDSSKATEHTLVEPRAEHYLCGGAIHSPQLLKMSGIGDASSLRVCRRDMMSDRKVY
jgi:choline dehydrogenase